MQTQVLLMEDNPALADRMAQALTDAGHQCRTVNGVAQALREIDLQVPHLLVADFHVVDGTAADLLAGLAERGCTDLPVLLATAAGGLARQAIRPYPQVRAIMDKPVACDQLLALVGQFADHGTRRAARHRLIGPDERHRLLHAAFRDGVPESPIPQPQIPV